MDPQPRRRRLAGAAAFALPVLLAALYMLAHWRDGRIIAREPPPADYAFMGRVPPAFPLPDATDEAPASGFELDLRHKNLSDFDLRPQIRALLTKATFDDRTIWPPSVRMPEGFDPAAVTALGKNPGLGLRSLHEQGVTGRGVSVGVVDMSLLRGHVEYRDQLRHYEEIRPLDQVEPQASMHGCAVVSLLAGKTVGAAPEANVYYVGATLAPSALLRWRGYERDFRWYARAVERLLEINRTLPVAERIRVISISVGWSPKDWGYELMTRAVSHAEAQGILVVSSSLGHSRGLYFHGLGRSPLADPGMAESYEPGSWWKAAFVAKPGYLEPDRLLVPMDSRATAAPNGTDEYVFYRTGGWSWSIAYIAGLYALAVQIDPDLVPEAFWRTAVDTAAVITWTDDEGHDHRLGPIVQPVQLIEALREQRRP